MRYDINSKKSTKRRLCMGYVISKNYLPAGKFLASMYVSSLVYTRRTVPFGTHVRLRYRWRWKGGCTMCFFFMARHANFHGEPWCCRRFHATVMALPCGFTWQCHGANAMVRRCRGSHSVSWEPTTFHGRTWAFVNPHG